MIKREKKTTLKKRVIGILVITIVPMFICMFIVSVVSLQTIRKQIYETSFDTLSLHRNQIDNELSSTADYVRSIDYDENYVGAFESNNTSNNYYAANYYSRTISPMVSMFDYVEGILIFSPKSDASVYNFNSNYNIDYESRRMIIDYMKDNVDYMTRNNWSYYKIGDKYVLIYIYKIRNTFFCSWTSSENLLEVTKEWKIAQNGTIYITTDDNSIMAKSGDAIEKVDLSGNIKSYYLEGKYLVLGIESMEGDFRIMEAIDIRYLTWTYERIFYAAVIIFMVFLLMIPVVLWTLNKNIFYPMGKMQTAIAAIDRGELNYQIELLDYTIEFHQLTEAFNSMVRQIENLKIKAYEDKIEQNRIMMQYLQLQIEPHFYLNALNTINAMAQVGDTDLILKLTKNLSEYMRFITKTKNGTVSIEEELNHIKNYMSILEIRLGDSFIYSVKIDEDLENFKIPPLVIQNLVENIIKYALNVYESTEISIRIKKFNRGNVEGIQILVEDNGNGYPEDIIQNFNSAESDSNRIGLENTRKRLFYLFGDQADFRISNRKEGGARAEIWIDMS